MAIQVGPPLITLDLTIGQVENLNPQGQAESGINTGVTLNTADTGITLSSGGVIKGGQTAFNTGNGFFLGYSGAQYKVSIGDPSGDNITWDGADLNITANTGEVTGDLTVSGNLTVNGTTTTLNTATLDVEDKNITLNYGAGDTSSTANGAGITIQDAVNSTTNATILWNGTTDAFDFSNSVNITGNITVSGTVDGRDVATDGTKLDGIEASADVTDAVNVTAAGALMDSELTSIASVKALNQGVATTDSPTFAGLTTTANVSFGDNDKAIFGAGSDLEIYHDGSHSYVRDSGTGHLKLQGTDVRIQSADGAENFLVADLDGAVKLYNDDAQKLQTTSTGIDVTGVITTDGMTTSADINFGDNDKAIFGAGSDLQIYHSGANSIINDSGTGDLRIGGSTNVQIWNSATSKLSGNFNGDGAATLYNNGGAKLATTSTGIDVTGTVVSDGLTVDGDGSFTGSFEISGLSPKIFLSETDTTDLNTRLRNAAGKLQIQTVDNSDANPVTRFQIDHSTGDISFYEDTGTTAKFFWDSSAESLLIGQTSIPTGLGASNTKLILGNFEDAPEFVAYNSDNVIAAGDKIGAYLFGNDDNNATEDHFAGMWAKSAGSAGAMDIHFAAGKSNYEDDSPHMTLDYNGNVGIGTDSPSDLLDISANGTSAMRLSDSSSPATYAQFTQANGVLTFAADAGNAQTGSNIQFEIDGSEAIRIDSSGNLLVGKTSAALAGAGTAILASGTHNVTVDGDTTLQLNRLTSDGAIATFFKDGSTVGSIGSNSSLPYFAGTSIGLKISGTQIRPSNSTGANNDNAVDLGKSDTRFKDLYLSGGVYLGGTASSNLLDDYEQGSWTPTADFANTSPTSGASTGVGRYTKVGNVVTVWGTVTNFNVTGAAGDLNLTGLPFVARLASSLQRYNGVARITNCDFSGFTSPIQVNSQVLDNSSVVTVMVTRDNTGSDSVGATELNDGVSDINFTLTYETDA